MPKNKIAYYNRIDIGIYLYVLELCMHKEGYSFSRTLFTDTQEDISIPSLISEYKIRL